MHDKGWTKPTITGALGILLAALVVSWAHTMPAVVHQTGLDLSRFTRGVPVGIWIALGISLGLSGLGAASAVWFGRRAHRQVTTIYNIATLSGLDDQTQALLDTYLSGKRRMRRGELDRLLQEVLQAHGLKKSAGNVGWFGFRATR